jgi:hypothetical protein
MCFKEFHADDFVVRKRAIHPRSTNTSDQHTGGAATHREIVRSAGYTGRQRAYDTSL